MSLEYKIKEHCGTFQILVKGYEIKGFLWCRRKEWGWYRANEWGGVPQYHVSILGGEPIIPYCETFNTLKKAEEKIKQFQYGAKYHGPY